MPTDQSGHRPAAGPDTAGTTGAESQAPAPFWPTGPGDLLDPAALGRMSGLDFISGIAEGRLPSPPILQLMNARFIAAERGRVVIEATPEFRHYNPLGGVHGGWYGTLLDSVLACSVQTMLPKGRGYTTLEFRVNILRGATVDTGPLTAIGEIDHVGRRTGVSHARLVDASGKLYATGSTTCLVLELPTSPPA
ncbi:MAG: PaaI family thioesterase [Pseudomonadota bacterium]